jgi:hypothetical protein
VPGINGTPVCLAWWSADKGFDFSRDPPGRRLVCFEVRCTSVCADCLVSWYLGGADGWEGLTFAD